MSSRERMLAAIRREPHDHVPLSFHIMQGPHLQEPFFWRDQAQRAQKLLDMGLDPTMDIWLPDPQLHRDVQVKSWREKKDGKIFITKEYHTPAGVLRQVVHETDDWCEPRHNAWVPTTWGAETREHFGMELFDDHNVSRRVEPWVKGPEDLEKLRYIIRVPEGNVLDEWRMDSERAMEYAGKFDILTQSRRTIVGDAFQWFCDIPWFMMQLYDDPGFVKEFFSIFESWAMDMVKLALDVGVDVVQYRGWYEIPNYFGPKFWKELILPVLEEQTKMVHSAGKYFSYLLPEGQGAYAEVLKDASLDVLYYIDPRMLHGGDLASLAKNQAESKSFWGGVNAEVTLDSGDQRRIEKEVEEAIGTLNVNNGLILSSGIGLDTPVQSITYMIEAWKKCGKIS